MDSWWAIFILANCAVWGFVLGLVNWWRYSELKQKVKKQEKITKIIDFSLYNLQRRSVGLPSELEILERSHQHCRIGKSKPVKRDDPL